MIITPEMLIEKAIHASVNKHLFEFITDITLEDIKTEIYNLLLKDLIMKSPLSVTKASVDIENVDSTLKVIVEYEHRNVIKKINVNVSI